MLRKITITMLLAASVTAVTAAAQSQWEEEIGAFEQADRTDPPPKGAVLFVGSSSIRMWTTANDDFPSATVLNRGFGGSQMTDLIHYAHRIVVPYEPRLIVLYEGDNDIAAGKSAEDVFRDVRRFAALMRNQLPNTPLAFIAIKPSLARWEMAPEMRRANQLVANYAEETDGFEFIDVWEPMLDADGTPSDALFIEDGLHMNAGGYAIWTSVVAPYISGD